MTLKLILRGLTAHWLRLGLSALAVILGVAFVAGTMIFSATLDRAVVDLFTSAGAGTDTVVRPQKVFADSLTQTPGEGQQIPDSVLRVVQGVPGVEKAHASVTGFAAVLDRQGRTVGSNQVGVDWTGDRDFSVMRLTSGHAPRTPDEIALDVDSAKSAGVRAGEQVKVATREPVRAYTLAGIFTFGESGPLGGTAIVAFEPVTAQRLLAGEPGKYDQIDLHARAGVSQQQLRDAVARVLPAGFEAITGAQAIDEQAKEAKGVLDILRTFLLAFAVISIFIGSFIIFNTFTMLIAQRTRDLALLRAIGSSRGQVTRMVLGEAAGVGLIGSTLGVLVGAVLAIGLRALLTAVGAGLPTNRLVIPASAVASAYAVGMVVTLLAAYLPARRAAKIPPVAAMREDSTVPTRSLRSRLAVGLSTVAAGAGLGIAGLAGSGSLGLAGVGAGAIVVFFGVTALSPLVSRPLTLVLGWPFARLFGATGRLSRENARRNPRRTAATASALMVGLALVATVSVLASSVTSSVDRQLDAGLNADYQVTAPNSVPFSPQVDTAVAGTSGVQLAVATRTARIKLDGTVRTATAGDPVQLVQLHRLRLEGNDGAMSAGDVLVSRSTATASGWAVGRTLAGQYQDGATATFRVAGIYADVKTVVDTIPTIILRAEDYRAHDPSPVINRVDVVVRPGADPAATQRALEAALAPWPNLQLQDKAAIKKEHRGNVDLLLSLVLVLLVLSVVIAALGIVNTLALSVIERTREIGLLRAVGMQRRQVRRMIRYEAVVISTFGAVLGLGVGVLFGWAIQRAMTDRGVDVLTVPITELVLYFLAGALIGVIAAIWPARRAARMDILRAIATQ